MVNAGAEVSVIEIQQALQCGTSGCRCLANSNARYHCPVHAGAGASLSVTEKDGKILVHCFSGCEGTTVVAALKKKHLWPANEVNTPKKVIVETYDYRGQAGELRFQAVRFANPKTFSQRQPDGRGGWQWNLKGIQKVLYRLPELLEANLDTPVHIVEGEKDVDRLRDMGLVATCNAMGAGKWVKSYSDYLKGRNVVVIPDNDGPGRDHADKVARLTHPLAASLKVVELPKLPEKGDLSDWLDAGHSVNDLTALIKGTPPWFPKETTEVTIPALKGGSYRGTDVGNGRRLIAAHNSNIRYCHPWGVWIWFTGSRWERDHTGELPRRAKTVIDSLFDEANSLKLEASAANKEGNGNERDRLAQKADGLWAHAKKSEGAARIAAMLEMAKSEPGVAIDPDELDADPWVMNCKNGTVDLKTGKLRPHNRDDLLTKKLPVSFIEDARLDLWDRFLVEAIPDEGTRHFVQLCVGATIAGVAVDDLLLILHGPGGTGKGTFLNAVQKTLGEYAASADMSSFTTKRDASAPQPDLARLQGRRMVAVSEPNTGDSVTLLKRATGGDPITTRSHHQESFEFTPQFTLWVISNDRPRVPHDDSGVWRRLREIPFTTKFAQVDTAIRTALTNPAVAGEAILAWAVKGCLEWQRDGVGRLPQQVVDATAEYRKDMDPLADWIEDNVDKQTNMWTAFKSSFADYQAWAKENGIRKALGRNSFGHDLAEKFTSRKGGQGSRGNSGLALNSGLGGISQMPLTTDVPVDSQNESHMEENQETKCHQMPPEVQITPGVEMPPESDGNATSVDQMPPAHRFAWEGSTDE